MGHTVYIAGPNGSGKTRFLGFIKWAGSDQRQSKKYFVTDAGDKRPNVVDLSFINTVLNDPNAQNNSQIRSAHLEIQKKVSTSDAATLGLLAITEEFHRYYTVTHPERASDTTPEEIASRRQSLDDLLQLIRAFVGLDIKPNKDGYDPCVDGKPLAEAKLSDGQRILLIAAITLKYQGGNLDDFVLLFDEPENHLHPSASAEVIRCFRQACPQGQIFIATHSVHLLAAADTNEIWYVNDGVLQKAGRDPQKILWSLLGDEPGRERLAAFIARPDEYARTLFAGQCLTPPAVADTPAGDPQTKQISQALCVVQTAQEGPLRVLDYGAGHARLLTELAEHALKVSLPIHDIWDYYAFNDDQYTGAKVAERCQQELLLQFPRHGGVSRYLSNSKQLATVLGIAPVQVVVMCNVLHEIEPSQWPTVFAELAQITTPDGYLLIVEDHCLRDGERAHKFGFLVLDAPQLKCLFDVRTSDSEILTYAHPDPRYAERLKAHRVPALLLSRVNEKTRANALVKLIDEAHARANSLRMSDPDIINARSYAYWTQQHFNAVCASKCFPI